MTVVGIERGTGPSHELGGVGGSAPLSAGVVDDREFLCDHCWLDTRATATVPWALAAAASADFRSRSASCSGVMLGPIAGSPFALKTPFILSRVDELTVPGPHCCQSEDPLGHVPPREPRRRDLPVGLRIARTSEHDRLCDPTCTGPTNVGDGGSTGTPITRRRAVGAWTRGTGFGCAGSIRTRPCCRTPAAITSG